MTQRLYKRAPPPGKGQRVARLSSASPASSAVELLINRRGRLGAEEKKEDFLAGYAIDLSLEHNRYFLAE